uniref:ADP/ATP translocase n=1 Tax=Parascaris equorum TaxID=6256 RepID=A0A914RZ49_PAREQ
MVFLLTLAGEDSQVPEDFTQQELMSGVWWRHLVAGEGGLKSFWRGNGVNVAKIAPESAIKFMAYEQTKRLIQRFKRDQELCVYERFMAGSSAGVISQSVIYPMEVLKTRLALRRTGQLDKGLFHFAQKMYRSEGLLCFYKTLKSLYVRYQQDSTEPGVLALLACGTCSSTCGQLASYPLALIRTRLQARSSAHDGGHLMDCPQQCPPAGLYCLSSHLLEVAVR